MPLSGCQVVLLIFLLSDFLMATILHLIFWTDCVPCTNSLFACEAPEKQVWKTSFICFEPMNDIYHWWCGFWWIRVANLYTCNFQKKKQRLRYTKMLIFILCSSISAQNIAFWSDLCEISVIFFFVKLQTMRILCWL